MTKDIFIVYLWLDCVVIILPLVFMMYIPKDKFMRWSELQKKYPHIKNDNLGLIVFLGAFLFSLGLMYMSQKTGNDFYFSIFFLVIPVGYLIAGMGLLISNIYGYAQRGNIDSARYFYDEDKKFKWIAKSQIVVSAIVSLVICYLIFS
jgi:hypothetical protein